MKETLPGPACLVASKIFLLSLFLLTALCHLGLVRSKKARHRGGMWGIYIFAVTRTYAVVIAIIITSISSASYIRIIVYASYICFNILWFEGYFMGGNQIGLLLGCL